MNTDREVGIPNMSTENNTPEREEDFPCCLPEHEDCAHAIRRAAYLDKRLVASGTIKAGVMMYDVIDSGLIQFPARPAEWGI